MINQLQSLDQDDEGNFIGMPYDPKELDTVLKRCYELMLEKKKAELYISEIKDVFPDKPIEDILKYMQQKNAIKIASKELGSPGDYNFFDSNDFLSKGGFTRIYNEEQALVNKQNKLKETEEKSQKKMEALESKIKRSSLVANRIAVVIAFFTALALIISVYQTYRNGDLESRLNKLENKIILSDTLNKIRQLTDSNSKR